MSGEYAWARTGAVPKAHACDTFLTVALCEKCVLVPDLHTVILGAAVTYRETPSHGVGNVERELRPRWNQAKLRRSQDRCVDHRAGEDGAKARRGALGVRTWKARKAELVRVHGQRFVRRPPHDPRA